MVPHKAGGTEALVEQAGIAAVLGVEAVANVSVRHKTDINLLLENYTKPHCYCVLLSSLSTFVYKPLFDPFCGCDTTLHAAEELNRQWIGIDISQFSAGLVRNRLTDNFNLTRGDIPVIGCPLSVVEAEELARTDPLEFEKWACGEVGARGLFREPGERGADGGVDGVIPFATSERLLGGDERTFAVVQVKGGKVHPDSVKPLSTTVRESGAKCGVLICFEKYMRTVENNREKKRLKDIMDDYNFIQGFALKNNFAVRGDRR